MTQAISNSFSIQISFTLYFKLHYINSSTNNAKYFFTRLYTRSTEHNLRGCFGLLGSNFVLLNTSNSKIFAPTERCRQRPALGFYRAPQKILLVHRLQMRFQQHNPAGRYLMPSYGAMKNNGADDHNKHWRHNQMGWRDQESRRGGTAGSGGEWVKRRG